MLGIADDYERTARPEPNSRVACLYHRSSGDGIGEAPRASFQAVCEQDRRLILGIAVTGMTFEIADRTRRRARFQSVRKLPKRIGVEPSRYSSLVASDTGHGSSVDDTRMEPRSWFRCRGNNRRSDRVSNRPAGDISKSCLLVSGPNQTVIQPSSWVIRESAQPTLRGNFGRR